MSEYMKMPRGLDKSDKVCYNTGVEDEERVH